jgi:hypothetical protein
LLATSFLFIQCSDSSTSVDPGTDNGSDNDTDPPAEFSHTRAPGQSGGAFITNSTYDQLVVEIQYMPGARPDDESITNLQNFLELLLDKSDITMLQPQQIPSGAKESYSASDVRNIEEENRSKYTDGSTLAAYALFLDSEYESQNVLGIAYFNTSTAYFSGTINRISGGIGQPSRTSIESTVFAHEFGHLMGLVNNGTNAQADHHDSENGAHCTVEECLMYYRVETTDFFANLFDGSVPELDDFCMADLEAVKN